MQIVLFCDKVPVSYRTYNWAFSHFHHSRSRSAAADHHLSLATTKDPGSRTDAAFAIDNTS